MDTESYVVQAGLKFIMYVSRTLNAQYSCLHLPRSGITGVHHHVWFYVVVGLEPTASCMSSKHSTHWSAPPALFLHSFNRGGICDFLWPRKDGWDHGKPSAFLLSPLKFCHHPKTMPGQGCWKIIDTGSREKTCPICPSPNSCKPTSRHQRQTKPKIQKM